LRGWSEGKGKDGLIGMQDGPAGGQAGRQAMVQDRYGVVLQKSLNCARISVSQAWLSVDLAPVLI
jgi:hypothetical protein